MTKKQLKNIEIKNLVCQKKMGLIRFEPYTDCNNIVKWYYVYDNSGRLLKFLSNNTYFEVIKAIG